METRNTYINKIIKTVLTAVVAGVVGYFLFGQDTMIAILMAGLPAGWRVLSAFFGRWVITGYMMIVYITVKICLSCVLGWIILPIDLILTVSKAIKAPHS